jgi:hypothetical protein
MSEPLKETMTNEEFDDLLKSDDAFNIAIRGHQAIETLLNLAISEVLSSPHTLEVRRVPFGLKLDLAVALGIVRASEQPAFAKMNSIRNKFAHDSTTTFGEREARDFFNTWSDALRRSVDTKTFDPNLEPIEVLRRGIAVLHVFVELAISHMRDEKAIVRHALERAEEVLSYKTRTATDAKIEALKRADRERRASEGRL